MTGLSKFLERWIDDSDGEKLSGSLVMGGIWAGVGGNHLQYRHTPNHYAVHLKLIQYLYINCISIKWENRFLACRMLLVTFSHIYKYQMKSMRHKLPHFHYKVMCLFPYLMKLGSNTHNKSKKRQVIPAGQLTLASHWLCITRMLMLP